MRFTSFFHTGVHSSQAVLRFQAWNTLPFSCIADFPLFPPLQIGVLHIPALNRCNTLCASHEIDTDRNADLPGLPLRIPIMKLLTGGTLKRKHCKEKHMGFFWWGEVEGGKIGRLFSMRTA